MRPVLVLRPEPGASATAGRAHALGLDAIVAPLFEVEPVDWQAPDISGFDGLLLTSANALRFCGEQLEGLRGLQAYAIGEATARRPGSTSGWWIRASSSKPGVPLDQPLRR